MNIISNVVGSLYAGLNDFNEACQDLQTISNQNDEQDMSEYEFDLNMSSRSEESSLRQSGESNFRPIRGAPFHKEKQSHTRANSTDPESLNYPLRDIALNGCLNGLMNLWEYSSELNSHKQQQSLSKSQKSKLNQSLNNHNQICEGVDGAQGTQMGDLMSTMIGPVGQLVRGGSSLMGQNMIDDDASDMDFKSSSESEPQLSLADHLQRNNQQSHIQSLQMKKQKSQNQQVQSYDSDPSSQQGSSVEELKVVNDYLSFTNLELLTKEEWKQTLPPLEYPRHLLELGGLLEVLESFQNDYHYSISSNDANSDEDSNVNQKINARRNMSFQWMVSRIQQIKPKFFSSQQSLIESENISDENPQQIFEIQNLQHQNDFLNQAIPTFDIEKYSSKQPKRILFENIGEVQLDEIQLQQSIEIEGQNENRYQTAPKIFEVDESSENLISSSSSSFKSFEKNIGTQSKGDPTQFSIKRLESKDNVLEDKNLYQIYLNNVSSDEEEEKDCKAQDQTNQKTQQKWNKYMESSESDNQ